MKKKTLIIVLLLIISIISGHLLSKASLAGKAGMSLFYREYNFLKVWWQGALLVFTALIVLFVLLHFIQRKVAYNKMKTISMLAILAGILGAYFTYYDFRHTLSHRLLGERFHIGAYLFWAGWLLVALFYFLQPDDHQSIHVHSVE